MVDTWEEEGGVITSEGGGVEGEVCNEEAWENHELRRRAYNPHIHTYTPVTFDAVVVQCFRHGGQSLLPRVTIGDQLGRQTLGVLPSYHHYVTGFM